MKLPKKTNRYCPFCKKTTEQKIKQVSSGHKRGSLRWGSIQRAKLRGKGMGMGNLGKWGSKPAATKFKRKTKTTKKVVVVYTCSVCSKSRLTKKGRRVSKLIIE